MCIEKVVIRKNLHYGRQETTSFDSWTSFDHSSKHKENCGGGTYNESSRGETDFRIQGLLHSTIQEQDHIRKEGVQSWFISSRRIRIKKRCKPTWSKITRSIHSANSMGNMESFEICEITPTIQCHCTCGTCLRLSNKIRKLNRDRNDVLSIPNYVIKKGPSHGARHGNTVRQRINPPCSPCLINRGKEKGTQFHTG